MLKNENKKIWKWADLQIIAFALKSFLMKGKKTHKDIIISDCAESANNAVEIAYKVICELLCEIYSKNPSDPNRVYRQTKGEKEKREKGISTADAFLDDLQKRYNKDFGESIDTYILNNKGAKNNARKESAEQSREEIKAEKQKQLERVNKRIAELIAERDKLQKELESYA